MYLNIRPIETHIQALFHGCLKLNQMDRWLLQILHFLHVVRSLLDFDKSMEMNNFLSHIHNLRNLAVEISNKSSWSKSIHSILWNWLLMHMHRIGTLGKKSVDTYCFVSNCRGHEKCQATINANTISENSHWPWCQVPAHKTCWHWELNTAQ
jgi:hypothetical protein